MVRPTRSSTTINTTLNHLQVVASSRTLKRPLCLRLFHNIKHLMTRKYRGKTSPMRVNRMAVDAEARRVSIGGDGGNNSSSNNNNNNNNVRIVKVRFGQAHLQHPDAFIGAARPRSEPEGDSFPQAIWPVLALAQCFGLMPVVGIQSPNQTKIAFRWRTVRSVCTGAYLLLAASMMLLYLKRIANLGINAKNMVGLVFFTCCSFCGLLFLFLAQRWPFLMTTWCRHEAVFLRPPYACPGWTLSSKIRLTAAIVLGLALVEHIMFLASTVYNFHKQIQKCNWLLDDVWKQFIISTYPHVFRVIPYHFLMSILVLYVNFTLTFAWNYMDIFVMMISIGLATRFSQVNQRLSTFAGEIISEALWHEIRTHFVLLCELLEVVDRNLAPIILLSCTNNLYFICFQLLNIFNSLPYLINYLYFWYSLLYLIGRTACVFLCAAAIHDASRKPLEIIRNIPTSGWCLELERFSEQVSTEQIALSGMKFFFLTRKLLFGMAGTIVTYELVLLQIDAGTTKTGQVDLCDRHT